MKWDKLSMAERAKYIKLGVQNGVTNLNSIREVYNSYADGGYIGDESNPIELEEVVVTPAPWQIDFHRNFGNKEIRKAILEQAAYNAIIPSYNEGFLDETTYPKYQTDYVNRLYNLWVESDKPKIYRNGQEPWYRPSINRANYSPLFNSIVLGENNGPYHIVKDVIAELAHPIQRKKGEKTGVGQFLRDFIPNFKNQFFDDPKVYSDEKSMEYETHRVIEPQLF